MMADVSYQVVCGGGGSLEIYYQNFRGLRTKTIDVFLELSASPYPLICGSESWLNNALGNGQLFPSFVFRNDRDPLTSGLSRGGGTFIAVYSRLKSVRRSEFEITPESTWVEISGGITGRILVGVFYFPPAFNASLLSYLLTHLEFLLSSVTCPVILLGDWNIPGKNWTTGNSSSIIKNIVDRGNYLFSFAAMKGLSQFNSIRNFRGVCLDLVFLSEELEGSVAPPSSPIVEVDPYHPALLNVKLLGNCQKIALQYKANLENLAYFSVEDGDFRWYLKLRCLNCGEVSDKWIYLTLTESAPLKGGRGEASLVTKCKLCSRENSIDILKDTISHYSSKTEDYSTAIAFECRGVEPVEFSPRSGYVAEAEETRTKFSDINLTEKEWADYDDRGKKSVGIYDLEYRFIKY